MTRGGDETKDDDGNNDNKDINKTSEGTAAIKTSPRPRKGRPSVRKMIHLQMADLAAKQLALTTGEVGSSG